MSKGDETRARILEQAAQVFSTLGYANTSMADLMDATGLQKGGLYNHFKSKDELALAAFSHAWEQQRQRTRELLQGKTHAADRLLALVELFNLNYDDPVVTGGCIVLNTAIETDDAKEPAQLALRQKAREAMAEWQETIQRFVAKGVERGQLRPDADGELMATLMISTLEGALMMSKLNNNGEHMRRAVAFLQTYIHELAIPNDAP